MLLAGCLIPARPPNLDPVRRSQPLLGTFVTITAYGSDRESVSRAVSAAFDEFRRIDASMSIHRADSEISRVNQAAGTVPTALSEDLFRVVAQAQEIAEQTDGAFDITVRPLVDLWGFIWKQYRLPTEAELKNVLPCVDYRLVALNHANRTIRFARRGVSLDLGGIAKGFAVDCAIANLRSLGVTNAMVKAGGDLRVIGLPPGQQHWEVQLEDPQKEGRRVTIPLKDAALSTSGNYENYFVVQGQRFSHILDPRTGMPVQGVASCSLIAPTCLESDAWATACFVYGVRRSLARFGQRYPMRFVERSKETESPLVVSKTPSFPEH